MGKNKKQQKKKNSHSVFKVAGAKVSKSKSKSKAVTSNLKKINVHTKSKTEDADASFQEVAKSLMTNTGEKLATKASKVPTKSPTSTSTRDNISADDITETVKNLQQL